MKKFLLLSLAAAALTLFAGAVPAAQAAANKPAGVTVQQAGQTDLSARRYRRPVYRYHRRYVRPYYWPYGHYYGPRYYYPYGYYPYYYRRPGFYFGFGF